MALIFILPFAFFAGILVAYMQAKYTKPITNKEWLRLMENNYNAPGGK